MALDEEEGHFIIGCLPDVPKISGVHLNKTVNTIEVLEPIKERKTTYPYKTAHMACQWQSRFVNTKPYQVLIGDPTYRCTQANSYCTRSHGPGMLNEDEYPTEKCCHERATGERPFSAQG